MRVYKLGAVALVSALALAACGGDDATTDPAAPADDQTPAAGGEATAPLETTPPMLAPART